MHQKFIECFLLVLCLCFLLSGCADTASISLPASSSQDNESAKLLFPVSASSADESPQSRLIGKWQFESGASDPIHLVLVPDGYVFFEFQSSAGRASKMYEGSWNLLPDGILNLDLELSFSDDSLVNTDTRASICGDYRLEQISSDEISLSACQNSPALIPEASGELLFKRIYYASDDPDHNCIHTDHCIHTVACRAAMDFYESISGHRPDSSRIAAIRPTGFLIHLYDKNGTKITSCAWYIIDPNTLTGYNYFTGESISLDGIAENLDEVEHSSTGFEDSPACIAALKYHEKAYNYRPGYAAVDSVQSDGFLIRLYDNIGSQSVACGWYVIDPDTLLGYEYLSGNEIDFNL